jgi:hypothetical protein
MTYQMLASTRLPEAHQRIGAARRNAVLTTDTGTTSDSALHRATRVRGIHNATAQRGRHGAVSIRPSINDLRSAAVDRLGVLTPISPETGKLPDPVLQRLPTCHLIDRLLTRCSRISASLTQMSQIS